MLAACVAWLAACGSSPAVSKARLDGGPALAIVHVTVIEMTGAPPQPDRTVLVLGDRIVRVAPAGEVEVPAGARVLDGRRRWLIPGLWDMHAHTSRPERDLRLYVANGITGIRDMGGEAPGNPANTPGTFSIPWSALRPIRDAILAGRTRGPHIVAAGVMLDAPKPWPGTLGVADSDDARAIVRRLHDERVDFIKIGSGVTPGSFVAIADEARRAGLPFAGHVPNGMTALEVADAGQRSIEHLMGLPDGCFADAGPDSNCTMVLRKLATSGAWSVPTLIAWRGRLLAADAGMNARPELRYVPDLAARWAAADSAPIGAALEGNRRTFAQFLAAVGRLRAAGVSILAGTDCANAYVVPGFALHDELRLLVEAGLTTADALAAATAAPTRFLGLSDVMGTIAPGKRADLVLLDADPLADIGNTSRISAVVLGGEILDRAALDSMLEGAVHGAGMAGSLPGAEEAVRAIEARYARAVAKQDILSLDRILAADFLATSSRGEVRSKAREIDDIRPSPDYAVEGFEISDLNVRVLGETAIATGRSELRVSYNGQRTVNQFRFTRVYWRRSSAWQVVSQHLTRIPP
jgi:imidazolonepropionase-like amidohydrolase/ketosteroid isomerase-like protein